MFIQQLIGGLVIGSIYALVAIGYTLIWRAMKVLNFSQGDVLMLGAYFGYTFLVMLKLGYIIGLLLSIFCGVFVGVIYAALIYPLRTRSNRVDTMVVTIAMSLVIENIARIFWGAEPLAMPAVFSEVPVKFLGALIPVAHIWIASLSCVLVVLLTSFFAFTKWGRAMRAAAQDRDTARLMGIPGFLTDTYTCIISTVLAVAAGVLISPIYFITTDMGLFTGLKAFLASTIGGLGSIGGALIGGFFMGIVENLGSLYISSGYKDVIAFVILIITLIVLPQGLTTLLNKGKERV